jgi:hypothetical protein
MEIIIVLLMDTLGHIVRRVPGCKMVVEMPQEAYCVMYDEYEIDE